MEGVKRCCLLTSFPDEGGVFYFRLESTIDRHLLKYLFMGQTGMSQTRSASSPRYLGRGTLFQVNG